MPVLSSVEMWMCVLLASISVVVVSLTYQHLRSVCCPRPFHICPEIERGSFVPSSQYPTRASLRVDAGAAAIALLSSSGGAGSNQEYTSKVKIKPTKSSLSLATSSTFLKRYLIGLYLEYQELDNSSNSRGGLQPTVVQQLLQHRATSQVDVDLPPIAMALTEQDVLAFLSLLLVGGDAAADNAVTSEGLFRPHNRLPPLGKSGSSEKSEDTKLTQFMWTQFIKTLAKQNMHKLEQQVSAAEQAAAAAAAAAAAGSAGVAAEEGKGRKEKKEKKLGKAHVACMHLVLRSNRLLTARKDELGNIFDAYDADGSCAMSAKEL